MCKKLITPLYNLQTISRESNVTSRDAGLTGLSIIILNDSLLKHWNGVRWSVVY